MDYLIDLVEAGVPNSLTINPGKVPSNSVHAKTSDTISILQAPNYSDQNGVLQGMATEHHSNTDNTGQDNESRVPGQEYFGSSEDILGWPIFEAKYERR